jgi:hypothetical protein
MTIRRKSSHLTTYSVRRGDRPDVWSGSKCEKLNVSKSGPLCPTKPTLMTGVATSLMGQRTKSLRSSPLRGSKSREAGSRLRG